MVPLISVVVAAYNEEKFIDNTIKSVLNQSIPDYMYELIIIDDGSTDDTLGRCMAYSQDYHIITVVGQQNTGLTAALILGCSLAKGRYIARLDAGDICHPDRLKYQLSAFKNNPELVLCGAISCVDRYRNVIQSLIKGGICYISNLLFGGGNSDILKNRLEFRNIFAHSSVMFSTQYYEKVGGYSHKFKYAQDYYLYSKLLKCGDLCFIRKRLVTLRLDYDSISYKHQGLQFVYGLLVALSINKKVDIDLLLSHENPVDGVKQIYCDLPLTSREKALFYLYNISKCTRESFWSLPILSKFIVIKNLKYFRNRLVST